MPGSLHKVICVLSLIAPQQFDMSQLFCPLVETYSIYGGFEPYAFYEIPASLLQVYAYDVRWYWMRRCTSRGCGPRVGWQELGRITAKALAIAHLTWR